MQRKIETQSTLVYLFVLIQSIGFILQMVSEFFEKSSKIETQESE